MISVANNKSGTPIPKQHGATIVGTSSSLRHSNEHHSVSRETGHGSGPCSDGSQSTFKAFPVPDQSHRMFALSGGKRIADKFGTTIWAAAAEPSSTDPIARDADAARSTGISRQYAHGDDGTAVNLNVQFFNFQFDYFQFWFHSLLTLRVWNSSILSWSTLWLNHSILWLCTYLL